jgi:hypothetical protein
MQTSINATAGLRRITVCGERQKWYVHVPDYGDVGIMPEEYRDGVTIIDRGLYLDCPQHAKATKLADMMRRSGLVVTATFKVGYEGEKPRPATKDDYADENLKWHRDEYCLLWRVTDVIHDEHGLSATLAPEPIADIGKKNKWQAKRITAREGRGSY